MTQRERKKERKKERKRVKGTDREIEIVRQRERERERGKERERQREREKGREDEERLINEGSRERLCCRPTVLTQPRNKSLSLSLSLCLSFCEVRMGIEYMSHDKTQMSHDMSHHETQKRNKHI